MFVFLLSFSFFPSPRLHRTKQTPSPPPPTHPLPPQKKIRASEHETRVCGEPSADAPRLYPSIYRKKKIPAQATIGKTSADGKRERELERETEKEEGCPHHQPFPHQCMLSSPAILVTCKPPGSAGIPIKIQKKIQKICKSIYYHISPSLCRIPHYPTPKRASVLKCLPSLLPPPPLIPTKRATEVSSSLPLFTTYILFSLLFLMLFSEKISIFPSPPLSPFPPAFPPHTTTTPPSRRL